MKSAFALLLVLIVFAAVLISYFFFFRVPRTQLYFEESKKAVADTERGFYVQVSSDNISYIAEIPDNINIVLVTYDIGEYSETELSEGKLLELERMLQEIRQYEKSVVFRAAYRYLDRYSEPSDIALIQQHIVQIAPILNAYQDVILGVQAGFIGLWGEWHGTEYFTGDANETNTRNTIVETLLNNLDSEIIINIRRPRFIRDCIDDGLDISRLGLHNDALFSSDSDLGTYDDPNLTRNAELKWLNEHISTGVNGGETTNISEYSDIDNVILEMQLLKLTYLNQYYNTEVLEQWKRATYNDQNGYTYIANHLGYRYVLDAIDVPEKIRARQLFEIAIDIKNVGFAPIREGYTLHFVVVQDDKVVYDVTIEQPLQLLYFSDTQTITQTFRLKSILDKNGSDSFQLGLYIQKDRSVDGAVNAKIQFANDEVLYLNGINYFAQYVLEKNKYIVSSVLE